MKLILLCITIHRYPIFSMRYSVLCKIYTGYHGTSGIEHGLCACTVDNPWDYLSVQAHKSCAISHIPDPKMNIYSGTKKIYKAAER